MRKGFTLLEILVVIIIVGILATLGMTQYGRAVERSRGAEAKQILGQLRSLAAGRYLEYNSTQGITAAVLGIGPADDQVPSAARASHYFYYSVTVPPLPSTDVVFTATRSGATGRGGLSPAGTAARTLILTTTFPAGTDVWGGTGGY